MADNGRVDGRWMSGYVFLARGYIMGDAIVLYQFCHYAVIVIVNIDYFIIARTPIL